MAVNITDLKKQLMSRIDTTDFVQVDKVDRYIDLVKSFRRISTIIRKEGETIVTENGKQKFLKAHPLIGERNKINSSLLSIEKSFGQKPDDDDQENKKKPKYNKGDLL